VRAPVVAADAPPPSGRDGGDQLRGLLDEPREVVVETKLSA
jgi:hypothetical protein